MKVPDTCGECQFFEPTPFDEKGALEIGICWFTSQIATRRFRERPCGLLPILTTIVNEITGKGKKDA